MHKDRILPFIALFILILIFGGVYYVYEYYMQERPTDDWLPPQENPPTKQMGVSIEVPEGWRGPQENPESLPQ